MQWLSDLVLQLLREMSGLDPTSQIGGSLHFFIYDVIKISYVQSYFPPERTRRILGKRQGLGANIIGALLVLFDSAFHWLYERRVASVILLASIFNWSIALAYVVVGLVLAVVGGTLIGYLGMENQVEEFVYQSPVNDHDGDGSTSRHERLAYAADRVIEIVHRVWIYLFIGVGIGATIHNWIPETFIVALLGQDRLWSVLVATIAGVPMYADIFGTLPIAEALVQKGVGLGTALTFMMAVTALSLPSMIMLKRVVKLPLLAVFIGIVTVGIIMIGYIFNAASQIFI